jgi:tRNA U34 5-methylaminomethyl-2-thiouridine-forming methyltransferase MnmC
MIENKLDFKIQVCDDGSKTIYLPKMNEYYHSRSGAISQSKYVYVKNGLDFIVPKKSEIKEINLLEIGFGTGLNAISTLDYSIKNNININYFTLEPFPLDENILRSLEQEKLFDKDLQYLISKIYEAKWDEWVRICDNFKIFKSKTKLEDFKSNFSPDVVYFDAFAPSKQVEMWSLGNLRNATKNMKHDSILVTYSAQGQFRRNLKNLGFEIEKLPGLMGKREMTRAHFVGTPPLN